MTDDDGTTQIVWGDGRPIVVRPMSATDTFAGGSGGCPASRLTALAEGEGRSAFQLLCQALIAAYGSMGILALDGRTIAGLLTFFPTWCPHVDICSDEQIREALANLAEIANPPPTDARALHVRCLAVYPQYRGHGVAMAMIECLKHWSRRRGWRTIVANGCIYSGRAQYQWLVAPKPPRALWEQAGFAVSAYPPLGLPAVSSPEAARASFEWYLSDAFPDFLSRDVAADARDWREIFADYTMVYRL